jgi:hypothetical protein
MNIDDIFQILHKGETILESSLKGIKKVLEKRMELPVYIYYDGGESLGNLIQQKGRDFRENGLIIKPGALVVNSEHHGNPMSRVNNRRAGFKLFSENHIAIIDLIPISLNIDILHTTTDILNIQRFQQNWILTLTNQGVFNFKIKYLDSVFNIGVDYENTPEAPEPEIESPLDNTNIRANYALRLNTWASPTLKSLIKVYPRIRYINDINLNKNTDNGYIEYEFDRLEHSNPVEILTY